MREYQSDAMRNLEARPRQLLIWLTLLLGLFLNLIPYPDEWFVYKPDFMAVLIAYWILRFRDSVGYPSAFFWGMLSDVAYTSTLGQHAFAYIVIVLVADGLRNYYVIAGLLQQFVIVVLALGAALIASLSVSVVFDDAKPVLYDLIPAVVGGSLWVLLPLLLLPAARKMAAR